MAPPLHPHRLLLSLSLAASGPCSSIFELMSHLLHLHPSAPRCLRTGPALSLDPNGVQRPFKMDSDEIEDHGATSSAVFLTFSQIQTDRICFYQ